MNEQTSLIPTQEERMLAVVSCITAHVFLGLIPLGIYLLKRRESRYVAYYASIGAMAGAMLITAILFCLAGTFIGFMTAVGSIGNSSPLTGVFSLIGMVIGIVQWPLLILAAPLTFIVMLVSAVSAWNSKLVELPIISGYARKFAGL